MDAKYTQVNACVILSLVSMLLISVLAVTPTETVYTFEDATLTLSTGGTYLVEPGDPLYAFSGNYNKHDEKVALEIPFGHLILVYDGDDLVDEDGDIWVRQ